jgi:uncharacterized protein DUF4389
VTGARAVRLHIRDPDLERTRLTVAFRLILAIPHLIWLAGWFSLAVWPVAIANWIATLIQGSPSPMLHRFLAAYVRYAVHVVAYATLAADPYPGFAGRAGSYPIDVDIDPPGPQNRWVTGFRLFLALPAMLLADTMLGFGTTAVGGYATQVGGVVSTVAFFAWFVCLGRGRMPVGFRDVLAYTIGYSAQVNGYLLLLTDRYPNSDPAVYESANVFREDPIRLEVDDDLRRSRLTTFFRLPLAVPHLVWLTLWNVAVVFALMFNWFVLLLRGRPSSPVHRFVARFVRYQTHVYAFLQLVANPFPGFTGRPGSYPVDVQLPGPEPQARIVTGFRLILALPALFIAGGLNGVASLAAVYSWFWGLFRGRVPRGLRNLGAYALRYNAQTFGYTGLLTDRYPYTGPTAGWQLSLESPPPLAAPAPR